MSRDDHYAYHREFTPIETVIRLQSVKRWHMIETNRLQTLAEHSANVAMLAYVIAAKAPHMYFGDPGRLMMLGLMHDVPEVFTGDIPSHTKAWLKEFHGTQFADIEGQVTPRMFKIPYESEGQEHLIKLCDLADGIRFIRLYGVDATARHAHDQLFAKYTDRCLDLKKEWPAVVIEHVMPRLNLYAFETRTAVAAPDIEGLERALGIDMA